MRRALPILAVTVLAFSTAACQNMPWSKDEAATGTMGQQTGAMTGETAAGVATGPANQALTADMVRDIQRTLSERGYQVGPVDGIYGESTQQALKNFQRDQNLRASGQVDQQTLAVLGVTGRGS